MRAIIILCLIATAYAGYNYPAVGQSSPRSFGQESSNLASPSYAAAPTSELEKEFYTFTVNDDDFSVPAVNDQSQNSFKRNLRVIFIKGPENRGLEDAAAGLARQNAEDKTHIYVLQKQADIGDLANKLKASGDHVNQKPEVHFVKYRTNEDAANAQRQIQSQYDALGGTSQSHNGGVAPVLNFASQGGSPGPSYGSGSGSVAAPSQTYLPSQESAAPAIAAPPSTYLPASLFKA